MNGLDQGELGLAVFSGQRTGSGVAADAVVVDIEDFEEMFGDVVEGADDDQRPLPQLGRVDGISVHRDADRRSDRDRMSSAWHSPVMIAFITGAEISSVSGSTSDWHTAWIQVSQSALGGVLTFRIQLKNAAYATPNRLHETRIAEDRLGVACPHQDGSYVLASGRELPRSCKSQDTDSSKQ